MPTRGKSPPSIGSATPGNLPGGSLFHAIFHNSPAMQSILDPEKGTLIEVNDTLCRTTGYERSEIVGRSPLEFNFWVYPERLLEFRKRLEEEKRVIGSEVQLRACDGRVLTVLLSSQMVMIDGVARVLSAGVDITGRKLAEQQRNESETRLRALYDSISSAVVVHDDTGFIQVNKAAMRMFKAEYEYQLLGLHPAQTSPERQPDGELSWTATRRHIERARAEGVACFEWVGRRLDGSLMPLEITLTPLQLDGKPVMQAVIHDLTERKQIEADLKRSLEQERELSQLRSEFVSLVSHEFRTPLEVIMSSVDNLQRYHERLPPEKRDHLLATINRSVRRMSYMMEEVLVLGRLETERMTFSPAALDLKSLCLRICSDLESNESGGTRIRLKAGPRMQKAVADESLLRHIFVNLLGNALKYSPNDSPVDFQVARQGRYAVFTISDTGCGIPQADQLRMFEPFQRGSNVHHVSGTGLGLLIVKRCVALHDGDVSFASTEGEGTTFTVRLPTFPT